jgi:hypothetical protein
MLPHGSAIRPWPSGKIMAATPQTPEAAHIRAAYIFLYVSRRQHMHAPGTQTPLAGGSIYPTRIPARSNFRKGQALDLLSMKRIRSDWQDEECVRDDTEAFSLEKTMSVQITPTSTRHTGMTGSTEGSVAAWQVTFQLDGDNSLRAAISIPLAGPSTHHEAQQKALKILQVFLSDACEAAKKYQF